MVFVPSRSGISHAPEEWSSVEDIARGADVMAAALLALDQRDL
jgi:N-carbamoyl-L-amino-acid hydrolase